MKNKRILQFLFILGVLTPNVISKTILNNQPAEKRLWKTISPICKIDSNNQVRFFAADAFRVCNEKSCPMSGEPGVFGVDCRSCCQNKKNVTENVEVNNKKPGIMLLYVCEKISMNYIRQKN